MSTLRHKHAIARIRLDAQKLTRREREAIGLPPRPIRRPIEPPPFPSDPSAYAWYVLTTLPQQEAAVAHRLGRAGYAAFNPTEVVLARHNRQARHKREARQRAILSSMVLVGFTGKRQDRWVEPVQVPTGKGRTRWTEGFHRTVIVAQICWPEIEAIEGVTGVVGIAGVPEQVPFSNVIGLHCLHGRRAATRNWSPMVDDVVEVAHGPFRERAGKVVELADGRAKVMLFGQGLFAAKVDPLDVPETWLRLGQSGEGD